MALKPGKYASKSAQIGLIARSSGFAPQIDAVSASEGYDQFVRQPRCKLLKTKRFPASLRLVSEKIDSYQIDPDNEFMT
ncbi:MAG: hypothetical protein ACC619_04895 [Paracoccaceae bacterium]